MKLHTLYYGKSKKKMRPIMVDSYDKCKNYEKARNNVIGFHEIIEGGDQTWKQKTSSVGESKCHSVARVGKGPGGYISKHGFQQHT